MEHESLRLVRCKFLRKVANTFLDKLPWGLQAENDMPSS